jgi:hypothetical protein
MIASLKLTKVTKVIGKICSKLVASSILAIKMTIFNNLGGILSTRKSTKAMNLYRQRIGNSLLSIISNLTLFGFLEIKKRILIY